MNIVINAVMFKIGWLSSVLGAAKGLPTLGPAMVVLAIAIHLRIAHRPSREIVLILTTGLIGAFWDSTMIAMGWVSYPNGTFLANIAPYWILGMWMLFATTLNLAFKALQSRLMLATLLGAVFGPLSYYSGSKMGAITLVEPTAAMIALSVAWAILMPALLLMASQLDGFTLKSKRISMSEA